MKASLIFTVLVLFWTSCPAQAEDDVKSAPLSIRFQVRTLASDVLTHFKDRVENLSKGAIAINLISAGDLSEAQTITAVSKGDVEAAVVSLPNVSFKISALHLFQQPFLFHDDGLAAAARAPGSEIRDLIEKAILKTANLRILWWRSDGPEVFLSRGVSAASPDNLINRSVVASGPSDRKLIEQCSGHNDDREKPSDAIPPADGASEIETATVSGLANPQAWKAMNTLTRTNHQTTEFAVVMNESFWQSLSPQQRSVLSAAAKYADFEEARLLSKAEDEVYRRFNQSKSLNVVDLTDESLQLWRFCSSDMLSEYLEQSGELGHRLMVAYGRLRTDPCCNTAIKAN